MTDRLTIADASRVSGADFFHRLMGTTPRDRSGEATYHEALNAHWRETEAKMDRVTGTHFEMLCRKMELINEDREWAREQARLFARGQWMPCEMRDAA